MNRTLILTPAWLRATSAAAALVAAVATVSVIGALAVHYESEAQLGAQSMAIAQR